MARELHFERALINALTSCTWYHVSPVCIQLVSMLYKKVRKHYGLDRVHLRWQKKETVEKSTTWCEPKFVKMNSICHLGLCTLCGFYHETKFAPLLWNRKLVLLFYFFFSSEAVCLASLFYFLVPQHFLLNYTPPHRAHSITL